MRITNNMLINNMVNYIGNNLNRMDKYQNQMATGKKISVASDDPVVAARALKLRTDVAEVEQHQRNVKDAQSWMDITEDALSKLGDVISKARELAVQASNGTYGTDDTKKINEEVKQLREQIIHLGNSSYAGRYIFSGYKTDKKFIDETTGKFATSVSFGEDIIYEVGIGDDININVPGGDLFNAGGAAVSETGGVTTGKGNIASLSIAAGANDTLNLSIDGGTAFNVTITPGTYSSTSALAAEIQTRINSASGTTAISVKALGSKLQFTSGTTGPNSNVIINASNGRANLGLMTVNQENGTTAETGKLIQTFDKLAAALNNGDHTAIANLLNDIDDDINNVLRIRADIGARTNRLELTDNRLESDNINFSKLMSENEDVDMAETIMNLQNEENVYKASLSGGARIIQPSLVDFLR